MKSPGMAILLAFVMTAATAPLCGQGMGIDGNGNVTLSDFGEVDLEKTLDAWEKQERQWILSRLELQVEQLTSVCKLTEADVKKLGVAIRGVTSKRIGNGREQLELFIYSSELMEPEKGREEWVKETQKELSKRTVDKLIPFGAARSGVGVVDIATRFENAVENHSLWRSSVKRALSKEQVAAFEGWARHRNESLVKTAIAALVAKLDSQLFLTEAQFASIGEQIMNELKQSISENEPATIKAARAMVSQSTAIPGLIESQLTESQLKALEAAKNERLGGVHWGEESGLGRRGFAIGDDDDDDDE